MAIPRHALSFTLCWCLASSLPAATLNLLDGTRLEGEIAGFDGGVYQVISPTLGTLRIEQARIRSIDYGAGPGAPPAKAGNPLDVQGIQQTLLQDPNLLAMIQELQSDPELQAVLRNPALLQAIATGDSQTLLNDEAFLRLMRNPRIQRIIQQARGLLPGTSP